MKKVFILACATFLSGQLMAQTTAKAAEAVQVKTTTELSKQQVNAQPAKTVDVITPAIVIVPASDLTQKAFEATVNTKVPATKQEATVELSKVAPTPGTVKAAPVKE